MSVCHVSVVGAPGCGKSSILNQLVAQHFEERYVPTRRTKQCLCVVDGLLRVSFEDVPGSFSLPPIVTVAPPPLSGSHFRHGIAGGGFSSQSWGPDEPECVTAPTLKEALTYREEEAKAKVAADRCGSGYAHALVVVYRIDEPSSWEAAKKIVQAFRSCLAAVVGTCADMAARDGPAGGDGGDASAPATGLRRGVSREEVAAFVASENELRRPNDTVCFFECSSKSNRVTFCDDSGGGGGSGVTLSSIFWTLLGRRQQWVDAADVVLSQSGPGGDAGDDGLPVALPVLGADRTETEELDKPTCNHCSVS